MNPKVEIEDEADYATVVEELRQMKRREGIWARAVAESDGDLSKAQARYLKFRVETLKEERRLKEEAIQQEIQEEIRRAQKKRNQGWTAGFKLLMAAAWIGFGIFFLLRGCLRS